MATQQRVPETSPSTNDRYYTWAELMRRVFAIDVLQCPRCQAPMRILTQIHPLETTRKILECLGWSTRPALIMAPRSDSQASLPIELESRLNRGAKPSRFKRDKRTMNVVTRLLVACRHS